MSREATAKKDAAVKASFIVAEGIAWTSRFLLRGCIFDAVHVKGVWASVSKPDKGL